MNALSGTEAALSSGFGFPDQSLAIPLPWPGLDAQVRRRLMPLPTVGCTTPPCREVQAVGVGGFGGVDARCFGRSGEDGVDPAHGVFPFGLVGVT